MRKNAHLRAQIFIFMEIIWVNFSKNKGMETEFKIINALSKATNIIVIIYDIKFHSHALIFGKVYTDYFRAL